MKKFLLLTLCCLLCMSMLTPAWADDWARMTTPVPSDDWARMTTPAPSNEWGLRGGAAEIVSQTDRYAGYFAVADDENDTFNGRTVNHAALQSQDHTVLIAASQTDGGPWQADVISTTALFQPGQTDKPLYIWHEINAFDIQYGDGEDGSERYSFDYNEELGEYVLYHVFLYQQREAQSNTFYTHPEGMIFWQSGPDRSFVPIGEAIWYTDGITLSEFNIAQMPRSMAEVRNMSFTALALDAGSVPLVTQKETFLTDEPTASQRALFTIPAGTELTGLARHGEFYAEVEWVQEGQTVRGFVPMKDLLTKYDTILTTGADLLMADVRWDVIDALCGKWFPANASHDERKLLIFFNDGGYRTSRLRTEENVPEGNFRVYDVENGDGSTYELFFATDGGQEQRCLMRLNEDGTITLTYDGVETVYDRNEYSSYGNG